MSSDETGIEFLRALARWSRRQREDCFGELTPERCITLFRAHRASEWDIPLENWTKAQIQAAFLYERIPKWTEDLVPILTCNWCGNEGPEGTVVHERAFICVKCGMVHEQSDEDWNRDEE